MAGHVDPIYFEDELEIFCILVHYKTGYDQILWTKEETIAIEMN
jgi:hypothetical protein